MALTSSIGWKQHAHTPNISCDNYVSLSASWLNKNGRKYVGVTIHLKSMFELG